MRLKRLPIVEDPPSAGDLAAQPSTFAVPMSVEHERSRRGAVDGGGTAARGARA